MRRRALEPVQYLTGCQSFRGLDLLVGPGVLVPRPETEIVVERALELIHSVEAPRVLDLGTGSGAIALAIASERPDSEVWASDVSRDALRWARLNFERLQPTFSQLGTPEVPHRGRLDVTLLEGDMFEAVPEELKADLDLVIVNPPYLSLAEFESAPADVRVHEPRVATLSGPNGLETPMRVIEESLVWLRPGGWLVMEIAPQRAQQVRRLLEVCYEDVAIRRDLAGRERVAEGRRRVFQ
jgi:release factor glutamine methyltransferase